MYKVVNGADIEPLTLEEAKLHLKIEHDDEDSYIENLIVAVRQKVENYTNRKLITQTIHEYYNDFNSFLRLSAGGVVDIMLIEYVAADGETKTLNVGEYQLDNMSEPCRIYPAAGADFPTIKQGVINPIKVAYTAGYGLTADKVPKAIKQAMLLMIGDFYENRTDAPRTLTQASQRLLFNYRIMSL